MIYINLQLIHVIVQQKPTQCYKAIILQLKIFFLKSTTSQNFLFDDWSNGNLDLEAFYKCAKLTSENCIWEVVIKLEVVKL